MTTSFTSNRRRVVIATPNHSKRSFTLRLKYDDGDRAKYRTVRMDADEFQSNLHNTQNDWDYYLRTENYFIVKK